MGLRPVRVFGVFWVAAGLLTLAAFPGCGNSDNAPKGKIFIETTPVSGATVIINNEIYGETPCEIAGLKPGAVYAILSKDGYKRGTQLVNVPVEGEQRYSIELKQLVAYLSLDSDPPGAEVYLDGTHFLGITPLKGKEVTIGDHAYELRMANYELLNESLNFETEFRYNLAHRLKPLLAELQVISRPSRSRIYINEVVQDETTPAKFSLAPEIYSISVYSEGHITSEQVVELKPNDKKSIEIVLDKGYVPPGMVLVPAGKFIRGLDGASPDEAPRAEIELPAFYIDKTEVTNAQFRKVFPSHAFREETEDWPVSGVNWEQATKYAQAQGKRLPTEMEWEKAARGTDGRLYPWGNTWDAGYANGLIDSNVEGSTNRVGTHRTGASPFGCQDMAGNVYEWTSDWYQAYPGNGEITQQYGQVFRVLRGGSFMSKQPEFDLRASRRHFDQQTIARRDYGFRCAQDATIP